MTYSPTNGNTWPPRGQWRGGKRSPGGEPTSTTTLTPVTPRTVHWHQKELARSRGVSIAVVDWRSGLRRIVNRPGELTRWRLALLRVIDPVEWYMRKDEERALPSRRAPSPGERGWVAYAPLRHDGQAGPLQSPPRSREDEEVDWERGRSRLRERFSEYFVLRAREVVAGRSVTVRTDAGTVRARLVRFRNGAVLERDVVTPDGTGHGMRRFDHRTLRDPVPVVASYLIDEVVRFGPNAEPLT